MKRPWRARVWFYRPGQWRPGWRVVQRGGDEWDWHTVVIGSRLTGAVVIATRRCPGTGRCAETVASFGLADDWPTPWFDDEEVES